MQANSKQRVLFFTVVQTRQKLVEETTETNTTDTTQNADLTIRL